MYARGFHHRSSEVWRDKRIHSVTLTDQNETVAMIAAKMADYRQK